VFPNAAPVIDSGHAVLDSHWVKQGWRPPKPQAHGGEMGPVAPVGVANPGHAESRT